MCFPSCCSRIFTLSVFLMPPWLIWCARINYIYSNLTFWAITRSLLTKELLFSLPHSSPLLIKRVLFGSYIHKFSNWVWVRAQVATNTQSKSHNSKRASYRRLHQTASTNGEHNRLYASSLFDARMLQPKVAGVTSSRVLFSCCTESFCLVALSANFISCAKRGSRVVSFGALSSPLSKLL